MVADWRWLQASGWLWSYSLPFNRHLWTSSMILWTGGWGFLVLAFCHAVIDRGPRKRRWTFPFVVIGSNAFLAYFLEPFVYLTAREFWTQLISDEISPDRADLLACGTELLLLWLILWWLLRQRLFFCGHNRVVPPGPF